MRSKPGRRDSSARRRNAIVTGDETRHTSADIGIARTLKVVDWPAAGGHSLASLGNAAWVDPNAIRTDRLPPEWLVPLYSGGPSSRLSLRVCSTGGPFAGAYASSFSVSRADSSWPEPRVKNPRRIVVPGGAIRHQRPRRHLYRRPQSPSIYRGPPWTAPCRVDVLSGVGERGVIHMFHSKGDHSNDGVVFHFSGGCLFLSRLSPFFSSFSSPCPFCVQLSFFLSTLFFSLFSFIFFLFIGSIYFCVFFRCLFEHLSLCRLFFHVVLVCYIFQCSSGEATKTESGTVRHSRGVSRNS